MKWTLIMVCTLMMAHCMGKSDADITTDCQRACDNLKALGCEEGEDFVDQNGATITCVQFCTRTENDEGLGVLEHGFDLDTECLATIQQCSEINSCAGRGHKGNNNP